ncbi:outer membrane biogenesis protein BamB [Planctomycetes bacterium Pan216]|uniref:Outer membrane biogenesis protein BamB n=1 Tax=Kolteria novifilia TaxID=2527975 RepID=A0A518B2J5_9BACT|nr:outer membrane biogenesis protein BamB [Planctomycetes bacterium Pan216]
MDSKRRSVLAIASSLLFVASAVGGDQWTDFRGPTGQGIAKAKGVPIQWSPKHNVTWKTPVPGEGWSSPIVYRGRIFLTSAVPAPGGDKGDLSLRAICLDEESGDILWNKEIFQQKGSDAPRIHSKNSHASPSPLIDDGKLFVHFGHQGTACLDLKGKTLWKNRAITYEPVHGNGGTPIVVDDLLIFTCDGKEDPFVVALDKKTGKERWRSYREVDSDRGFSFCTPLAIEVDGKTQVICPGSNVVSALDPETGEKIWSVDYYGWSVVPRPVFGKGLVFISTGYMTPSLLAIRPDGKGDVTDSHVVWSTSRAVPNTPSMLQVEDELYTVSDKGIATCFDAATGKVHWRQRLGGNFSASPLYADEKIYFQSEDGKTTVIHPGTEFIPIAENDLDETTFASYAVSDGAFFIRTKEHLYRFDEKGELADTGP